MAGNSEEGIVITCPHCGTAVVREYFWAMTHFTTRCTSCRTAFLVDRAYLLKQLQQLQGRGMGSQQTLTAKVKVLR